MLDHLDRNSRISLYEQIYEDIKSDILSGRLVHGEKLPSKRTVSERLGVSLITVENAYAQLIAEGYVRAAQRSGYFVQYNGEIIAKGTAQKKCISTNEETITEEYEQQESTDSVFPFSVWARLMRSVILEKGTAILRPVRHGGAGELCSAISDYLYRVRGFYVPPKQIIVGAGTEYLYNLLIQLLGRHHSYGIENPGYEKLARIYELNNVKYSYINLDKDGMNAKELKQSGVTVAHISPAHHYPTGIVMPISRRREIMRWAKTAEEHYIIEDDYDSEFRWIGKPVPTMFGMDDSGRVIYINTFSQTIAPSVRISYMCLPEELYRQWEERLGFYSCSVPAFEQYTLARFISEGCFERHINRTKKRFRRIRELVLRLMDKLNAEVNEENAGLHFTMKTSGNAENIISKCEACGIRITPLADYYSADSDNERVDGSYVVNYAGAQEDKLLQALST